ncbi:MAG: Gfo/Idh/MocA family oxidoreductase [Phycisphaerales bacterium]
MPMSRRDFVKSSAGAAVVAGITGAAAMPPRGASAAPRPSPRTRRLAPSARLSLGFIGCGKRAFELLPAFLDRDDCVALAVCDVDTTRREHARKMVDDRYAALRKDGSYKACDAFNDYRDLLARADIDAVVITTPDHWHAAQIIDAARSQKDIYCEKPMTLTLAEGKACIDAVRKHNRVFQTGSQQRTEYDGKFRTACEYVRSGRIGKVISVNVGVGDPPTSCDLPEEAPEPGLDWDRWLGPAPARPYCTVLSPRGVHSHYPMWRKYWEYAGGLLADMGAHHFDIAQWGLAMDASGPFQITPPLDPAALVGARMQYGDGTQLFHGGPSGTTFIGTDGIIAVDRGRIHSIPDGILKEPLGPKDTHLHEAPDHISAWIDCIHSRLRCICDVEIGARSAAVCQLANIAYRTRKPLLWDPESWKFVGENADAGNALATCQRRAGFELPDA